MVRSVSGTRACDEGVFFSFLFFSIRGSRRRSISGLSANLLSPLFSLLSLKQHFLYSISFHPYHVDFFRVLFPHRWVFTHCCYEWMVGVRKRREGKKRGEVGKTQKGGEGKRGRKGMREKGMRKPVAVINSACFLYLDFSHLSRNLLPLDQVCISLSLVPSHPVPSRPVLFHYPFFLEPSRLLYLSSYLITPHLSHFLSFPFLLLFHPTPPPPTHQPTHSRSPSALLSPTPASSHSRFDTRDSSISADGWSSLTSFLYGLYIVHLFDFFPRLWEGSEGVWKQRFLGGTGDRMFRLVGGDSMGCGWGGGGSVLLYCFWNS